MSSIWESVVDAVQFGLGACALVAVLFVFFICVGILGYMISEKLGWNETPKHIKIKEVYKRDKMIQDDEGNMVEAYAFLTEDGRFLLMDNGSTWIDITPTENEDDDGTDDNGTT